MNKKKNLLIIVLVWLLATCLMFVSCAGPEKYCPANNYYGFLHHYNHCNRVAY